MKFKSGQLVKLIVAYVENRDGIKYQIIQTYEERFDRKEIVTIFIQRYPSGKNIEI